MNQNKKCTSYSRRCFCSFIIFIQLVDSKVTNQNLELMQSCRLFENCSKVALGKVVDLIRWKAFRPGTGNSIILLVKNTAQSQFPFHPFMIPLRERQFPLD